MSAVRITPALFLTAIRENGRSSRRFGILMLSCQKSAGLMLVSAGQCSGGVGWRRVRALAGGRRGVGGGCGVAGVGLEEEVELWVAAAAL